jgi:hypothetical protein
MGGKILQIGNIAMKKLLAKLLSKLSEKLLPRDEFSAIESPFQSLTPTDDAEDIKTYSQAMDFALAPQNDKIYNIAVTGLYGSGKSSFLRTHFKNKENVLWVSLAMFLDQVASEEKTASEKDKIDFEHKLELSILQQIFLVRKESTSWSWKILTTLVFIGLGIVGIIQPDPLVKYVTPALHHLIASHSILIFWVSLADVIIVSLFAFHKLFLWCKSIGVKRVDLAGGGVAELEIEMQDVPSCSILNRNIRSMISFFNKASYNTVVFEDIDRFDDIRIFTKLREVNLLLNNSQQIGSKKKPIRFIYALREELFPDETSKVKFFDFVIPIIPHVNASNSRTELLSFLKEWGDVAPDAVLTRFVKEVSPYISDMRLLKNICNEYYMYKEQVIEYTSEKELLGLIVFKNFFPKNFALMHKDDGIMWELLEAKRAAQESQTEKIDDDIKVRKDEIGRIKNEKLSDVKQLQLKYYVTLMREFNQNHQYVIINRNQYHVASIIHFDDWFESLRNNRICSYHSGNTIRWADIEKKTDPTCSYEEHVKLIEAKQNDRINTINQEIQDLRDKRKAIKRKTIQELIADGALEEVSIDSIVGKHSEDRQDMELVYLLLRNGYLNENYYYNISIFKEVDGINSYEDYRFELDVNRGVETDWDKLIKNPKSLIESIDLHYFSTSAVRNYDICYELMTAPESEKAKDFIQFIAKKDRDNYEFVNGYLDGRRSHDDAVKFFSCIMSANPNYMEELITTSFVEEGWPRSFVEKQLGLYLAWAMRQERAIMPMKATVAYIEETESIPRLLQENEIDGAETMTALMNMFGLKFKKLDFGTAKEIGLIDVVIAENAYAIEGEMIKGLLQIKDVPLEEFENKNYTLINNCGINSMISYVDSNFFTYLDRLYTKLEADQSDNVAVIAKVLNRDDISDDDKIRFIKKQTQQGRIDDVSKLKTDSALGLAVKANWILPTWNNAAAIWNRNKDNLDVFWEYVNNPSCYQTLAKKNSRRVAWTEDEGWGKYFAEEDKISEEAMSSLLNGMDKGFISSYSGKNATPSRIERLIRGGRIKFSKKLYITLREIDNGSHITLAAMCIKDFCGEYEDGLINKDDARKMLSLRVFNQQYLPLVANTIKHLIVDSEELAIDIASKINISNYAEIDESVLDSALSFITPDSLQCKVIQHIGGNTDNIRERLRRMSEPYKKLGELGTRPHIKQWEGLDSFIEFLKSKGVVSSTSERTDGTIQVNTTQS